jgi:hypothetical protein
MASLRIATARLRPRAPVLALAVLLAASLALTLRLSATSRALRTEVLRLRQRALTAHPGLYLPPHRAATLGGDSAALGPRAGAPGPQLLFYVSADCGLCTATAPIWDSVARAVAARHPQVDVRWLSIDSMEKARRWSAAREIAPDQVVLLVGEPPRRWYRALAVPQTVLIDSAGQVTYAHAGVFTGRAGALDTLRLALARSAGGTTVGLTAVKAAP